ncbi:galactose-1-epimerase [Moritella marina ATCC 15381]|uniref:Aldose 1-epimerase n=1 Tax=Moritella marina ATCC 15381 TaxID=1202962 RepID=A0A5J6WMW7_MORMI|nr:galactose-1-epimerase [Moritella marina]QFI38621.1 galactose-1-epimerase [Moritella marina ATCC 15381]
MMIEQSSLFDSMTAEVAFDGRPAQLFELQNNNGMTIMLMDIGAAWLSCKLPVSGVGSHIGELREVLLGQATMADFKQQQSYMGVTVGRVANRIAKGQFSIAGVAYQVDINQAGNTLHGGTVGFDKRRWTATDNRVENSIEFELVSPDGDQGFPGELTVRVKYQLTDDNAVVISYSGNTTQATPINLTNHAYFNLLGADSGQLALTHSLSINSDVFVPTDEVGIPTGEWLSVQGGNFDFTIEKRIEQDFMLDMQQQAAKGYDHAFVLDKRCLAGALAARLTSPDNRVSLDVFTSKPAMQLYSGNWLAGTADRMGGEYQDYAGIALETQFVPDALNHPDWEHPSSILQPGTIYQQQTRYQFNLSFD